MQVVLWKFAEKPGGAAVRKRADITETRLPLISARFLTAVFLPHTQAIHLPAPRYPLSVTIIPAADINCNLAYSYGKLGVVIYKRDLHVWFGRVKNPQFP